MYNKNQFIIHFNDASMKRIGLFRRLKLSRQILLLLLVIPFFLVSSLLYYSLIQHIVIKNKPLEQLALSTSATVSEKVDRGLAERCSDVQAFAYNKLAVELLLKKGNHVELQNYMNEMMQFYSSYDLMMLCDISGNVLAINNLDKSKNEIATSNLLGKNFSNQEWFRSAIVVGGPVGGAFYSDFNEDEDVEQLFSKRGWGMDFSAPVYSSSGEIIGVWRNRANWQTVAQQVRKESEASLQKDVEGSIILLMDKQGHLIDAAETSNIMKVNIGKNNVFKKVNFKYGQTNINEDDFIYGWSESKGLNNYKGNQWKILTLIPKVKFSDYSIYFNSDWKSLVVISFIILLIGAIISLLFVRYFSRRLNIINRTIRKLSEGEPEEITNITMNDEIGEMSKAVNQLSQNFIRMTQFSDNVGNGNFDETYSPKSERDVLGMSLLRMQSNLKHAQSEIQEQKWMSDCLSKLGEILREQDDSKKIYSKAISFLAKAINAHQAALYVVDFTNEPVIIKLKGGYALHTNQLDNSEIYLGDGNLGQAIINKELIKLNNIPEDFIKPITSGLGESVPKEVVIVPIIYNDVADGAMEFSTFTSFRVQHIVMLEKAGEYIGSYILQKKLSKEMESSYS